MQYKQIISTMNPLTHWTFESHGAGTVYDEYNNFQLTNSGAALGVGGSPNTNYSGSAANLNGGQLQVNDTSFNESNVSERSFTLSFLFKLPNRDHTQPIAGFKPLVQKWNPEQQYWIGFENGNLVAKIQTNNGVVNLEFDDKQMVYNNRWNLVVFWVTPSEIQFNLNAAKKEASNADPIPTSSNSLFQVGGAGAEAFAEDVLISDLSVMNDTNQWMQYVPYRLCRSDGEIILDWNPTYYFDLIDGEPTEAYENKGRLGGYGYIVTPSNYNDPYKYKPSSSYSKQYVRMDDKSYFMIDQPLECDFGTGVTFMFDGRFDPQSTSSNAYDAFRFFDLRNAANNNNRLLLAHNHYGSYDQWLNGYSFDSAGAVHTDYDYYTDHDRYGGLHHYDIGWSYFTVHQGLIDAKSTKEGEYNTYSRSMNNMPVWDAGVITYDTPTFFHNIGASGCYWADLGKMMIFDRIVDPYLNFILTQPKWKLMMEFLDDIYSFNAIYHGWSSSTDPNLKYIDRINYTPYGWTSGHSWVGDILDPNHNRSNQWTSSGYLPGTGNYIAASSSSDHNIGSGDCTFMLWVWNRNTSDSFRIIHSQGNSSGIELWLNTRDGQFSYGDVEFATNGIADKTRTVYSINKKVVDDGFHLIHCIRRGLKLELWIDAELIATHIVPSIAGASNYNNDYMLYGGPIYYNDYGFVNKAMQPRDIEFMYGGFNDVISGRATLNGEGLPSTLIAMDYETGQPQLTHATDDDGYFDMVLPKNDNNHRLNIVALAQDDNATNNVVIHGPYNTSTIATKFNTESFDRELTDMMLDMEPYALYPMNDTVGTQATDISGNGRHGTITGGVTLDKGAMEPGSKAFDFDGTDGFIDLPDGYDDLTNGFTLEVWVNYDSYQNWSRVFDVSSAANGFDSVRLANETTGSNLQFTIEDSSSNNTTTAVRNGGWIAGNWQHIVCRITPDGNVSVWLHGHKLVELTGQTLPPVITRTLNFIGRSSHSADSYFNGQMSTLATYMYPLSDEDIHKHAYRGYQIAFETLRSNILKDKPLVYWTFDRVETNEDIVGAKTLDVTGSVDYHRNSVVFNEGIIGNNYMQYNAPIIPAGAWSLEFGFKTGVTNTDGVLVSEWNEAGDTGSFKVQLESDNLIKLYIGSSLVSISSTTTYNDGLWHYVVITNDGSDNFKLYVDGVEEASISSSMTVSSHNFTVGNTSDGHVNTHLEGETWVDDLAVYSGELSPVRIDKHFEMFEKKKVYQ